MDSKKIAIALSSLLIGGIFGGGVAYYAFPQEKIIEKPVIEKVEVPVEKVVEKVINNTIEVPVEKVVEKNITQVVYVNNEKLDEVLQYIYDENGNIEYVIEDLKDDEVKYIVDRITFVNEHKVMAVNDTYKDLKYELDDKEFNGVIFDKRDIEKIKVDDEFDEIRVVYTDFDDGDITLQLTGSFEQDHEKYKFTVEVEYRYGEFENINIISVE